MEDKNQWHQVSLAMKPDLKDKLEEFIVLLQKTHPDFNITRNGVINWLIREGVARHASAKVNFGDSFLQQ